MEDTVLIIMLLTSLSLGAGLVLILDRVVAKRRINTRKSARLPDGKRTFVRDDLADEFDRTGCVIFDAEHGREKKDGGEPGKVE